MILVGIPAFQRDQARAAGQKRERKSCSMTDKDLTSGKAGLKYRKFLRIGPSFDFIRAKLPDL